jgi:hypothetical protein
MGAGAANGVLPQISFSSGPRLPPDAWRARDRNAREPRHRGHGDSLLRRVTSAAFASPHLLRREKVVKTCTAAGRQAEGDTRCAEVRLWESSPRSILLRAEPRPAFGAGQRNVLPRLEPNDGAGRAPLPGGGAPATSRNIVGAVRPHRPGSAQRKVNWTQPYDSP